jgi:RNA polymerase sigma factor (sigma-70 family)
VETPTDSALMKLVQAGNPSHLATLFERYHVALFRYVLQLTRNRALSEDLVQEVFFRVLKYAQSYDPNLSFAAWLYGMARNACFDALHKGRAEQSGGELEEMRSPEPMAEDLVSRKQDAMHLQEALQKLSDAQREVLVLSRFHNLRYEEIARILRCEIGTVKVRVYRALKELRDKFCEVRGESAQAANAVRCARVPPKEAV